jgi:hypothetical protein
VDSFKTGNSSCEGTYQGQGPVLIPSRTSSWHIGEAQDFCVLVKREGELCQLTIGRCLGLFKLPVRPPGRVAINHRLSRFLGTKNLEIMWKWLRRFSLQQGRQKRRPSFRPTTVGSVLHLGAFLRIDLVCIFCCLAPHRSIAPCRAFTISEHKITKHAWAVMFCIALLK